jgi:hypothetical protein
MSKEGIMRIVDNSTQDRAGKKSELLNRARSRLSQSWSQKEAHAQEVVINALQKVLDNKFVMLREVTLEGPDIPIPLILVGPTGVHVFYASTLKGVFRAKEDVWEELDDRTQKFGIARPNLLTRTLLMARSVHTYLEEHSYKLPEVEPVLFFSDPGINVEITRPVVRIVQMDALDRYVAGLLQSQSNLEAETVQKIVNSLAGEPVDLGQKPLIDERDAFAFRDLPPEKPKRVAPKVVMDHSEPGLLKRVPFSSRQWLVLGLLIVVTIIVLIAFMVLLLLSS